MITARKSGNPALNLTLRIGAQILTVERIKAAGGKLQLLGGGAGAKTLGLMLRQDMTNERGG